MVCQRELVVQAQAPERTCYKSNGGQVLRDSFKMSDLT